MQFIDASFMFNKIYLALSIFTDVMLDVDP